MKPSQSPRRRKAAIDHEITVIYTTRYQGAQINVLDIEQLFTAGHAAAAAGTSIEEAVVAAADRLVRR